MICVILLFFYNQEDTPRAAAGTCGQDQLYKRDRLADCFLSISFVWFV